MEWWELVLFLVVCIVGGSILYIALVWLISLVVREPQTTSLGTLPLPFTFQEPEAPSVIEEQPKLTDPKLIAEVENNLRIATEPWTGEFIPFDTCAWDAQQYGVYQLPTKLRSDLIQVYADIGLANQLVWLSTEFNRRSQNLDEGYRIMRTSIAERLHRIKQNVE